MNGNQFANEDNGCEGIKKPRNLGDVICVWSLGVFLQVLCHGLALQTITTSVALEKGREILQDLGVQQVLGGELLGRGPEERVLLGHEICKGWFDRISTDNVADIFV